MFHLIDILFFVILLGVLIFVHELGHFLLAKAFGVKVFKFSLGFGPRLVGFRKGETEYLLSAVPLGGYVKMLGESGSGGDGEDDTVPDDPEARRPEDVGRALTDKPRWQRALIMAGGPVMNLLFPILLYFVVLLGRNEIAPPSIGTVLPGTPAAEAGLLPGDRVLAIDDETIYGFEDLVDLVEDSPGETLAFRVRRGEETLDLRITPKATDKVLPVIGSVGEVGRIGVAPYYRAAVLGHPGPGAPAGIETFDEIVALDGTPVRRYLDLERHETGASGRLDVGLLRGAPVAVGLGTLVLAAPHRVVVPAAPGTPAAEAIAATPAELVVSRVTPGGAAAKAGLRPGDLLLALDGKPLIGWHDVQLESGSDVEGEHTLLVARGDAPPLTLQPVIRGEPFVDSLGQEHERHEIGAGGYNRASFDDPIPNPNRIGRAFHGALAETANVIHLTALGFVAIFSGKVSVETIGGPVLIFDVAAQSADAGAGAFLYMMALISINLGLLNLLPIPVLDGGHLIFLAVEAIRRKPLSNRVREVAQTVGLVLILLLVALALRNDIARKWTALFGG
jgi:regulator of sigma E protease